MPAKAKRIEISDEDRALLERTVRSRSAELRAVERARIVLEAGEGRPAAEIARRVGCHPNTARKWRERYEREGMAALADAPRPGRPLVHGHETRARLIALACTRPEETEQGLRRERWTHRELAEAVGMSVSQAHEILRAADIRPHLTEQWVMSELDPDFDAQAAEVCGLYLDPPANAIVLSIDEKTGIQAKGLARPDSPPAPARPARRDNEYVRNGTQNLFAALAVHSGEVTGMPSKTRNRFDLIRFLDQLDGEIPAGKQVVAITDNLSTRTTQEVSDWLADHPRWSFQFTPKHASWLNQVEIFFSILARRLIKHGHFESEHDLATQMLAFLEHYNLTAKPFAWTYTGKVLAA
ncbi:MAG TPA: IS630 family transposase [Thermoleophilaceae bacterium]|nr:IS630 family transposase [Thermoleophilaceae bacterium]